jgi:hypothetical protein
VLPYGKALVWLTLYFLWVKHMSEEKLTDFLKTGKEWTRMRTSVPGVFVLKLPPYKSSPTRLVVELNPVDETGRPKKRRGLVLRSSNELEDYKELFQYEKLSKLLGILDSVNPRVEAVRRKKGEEVIEL